MEEIKLEFIKVNIEDTKNMCRRFMMYESVEFDEDES